MHTLLLRLVGPLQSWGTQSHFTVRDTGLEPSKSGVMGLLCAALGWPRTAPVEELASLMMGVRIDQEGTMARDYHTAMNIFTAGGKLKPTEPSNRYYLANAAFLVGLESPDLDMLQTLHAALRNPVWPFYLGRKAFVPGEPVWLEDGLHSNTTLLDALCTYPWLGPNDQDPPEQVRFVLEDPNGETVRLDQPLSFAERRFAPRRVTTTFINIKDLPGFQSLIPQDSIGGEQ
ncbi:MAG: type I-E CRISPR-associated protein Cas5/CasD [Anaerolineae bacterium]|nr:type I-E CRISPR-associated protein Cas5/CasD [Anaerolineae bacterium]